MEVGDLQNALPQLAPDWGAHVDRRSVRAQHDRVTFLDSALARVFSRDRDLGERAQELQLGHTLDPRSGEQWPVPNEPQSLCNSLLQWLCLGRGRFLSGRRMQRGELADLAEGNPAERDLRHFLEDRRRVGPELDAEAFR